MTEDFEGDAQNIEGHPYVHAAEIKNFPGKEFGYSGKMRLYFTRTTELPEGVHSVLISEAGSSLTGHVSKGEGIIFVTFEDMEDTNRFEVAARFKGLERLKRIFNLTKGHRLSPSAWKSGYLIYTNEITKCHIMLRDVSLRVGKMFFENYAHQDLQRMSGFHNVGFSIVGKPNLERVEWSMQGNMDYDNLPSPDGPV